MKEAKTEVCVSFCSLMMFYILAAGWQMLTKKPLQTNGKTIKIDAHGKSFKKTSRVKKLVFFIPYGYYLLEDIFAPIRQI